MRTRISCRPPTRRWRTCRPIRPPARAPHGARPMPPTGLARRPARSASGMRRSSPTRSASRGAASRMAWRRARAATRRTARHRTCCARRCSRSRRAWRRPTSPPRAACSAHRWAGPGMDDASPRGPHDGDAVMPSAPARVIECRVIRPSRRPGNAALLVDRGISQAARSLLKFKPCRRVPIASTLPTSS
ncbi:protein of unknown function [Burkholderia multivorans]